MRILPTLLTVSVAFAVAGRASAAPLPAAVAKMLDAVADDPAALKAVAMAAKKANPASQAEVDAHVAALASPAARPAPAPEARPRAHQSWTGEGELGGFVSTGNTDENGVAAGLKLRRTSGRWRQIAELSADYKRADDAVTKEKYAGVYTLHYTLAPRAYTWGRLSLERDRIAGFDSRISESLGLGYRAIETKSLSMDLEAGPALRQTDFAGGGVRRSVAARLAEILTWQIADDLRFSQTAATFLESGNSTFVGAASLTTQLRSALSARASFDVRHDQNPPNDREKTDTTGRITLVMEF